LSPKSIINQIICNLTLLFLSRVNTLAWDATGSGTLYLGGLFDLLEDTPISSGLAIWTPEMGLISFPGGGLTKGALTVPGMASSIAYEPRTQVKIYI
jgi:hypothetical protein